MFAQWLALRSARLRYLFLQETYVEDVALVYAQENLPLVTIHLFLVSRNLKNFLSASNEHLSALDFPARGHKAFSRHALVTAY